MFCSLTERTASRLIVRNTESNNNDQEGEIEIKGENGQHILNVQPGQICGEHSLITKSPRNVTAVCASNECKVHEMKAKDFYKIYNKSPDMKQSLREVCLR